MRHPDADPSLWTAVNPPPPPAPVLLETLETEIAIVGAGIAGLSTALHLRRAGTDVVILEAMQQPPSATAASAGVIAPQLVRATPDAVRKRLGEDAGSRLLRLLAESGRYLFNLIKTEDIACDAQPFGFINPVRGAAGAEQARSLIDQWTPFRNDLTYADAGESRLLTGCEGYSASVIDPSGGGLDPVAYARGLAAHLHRVGVPIFRDTKVLSIERQGSRWALKTAQGLLLAHKVVLCANGGNAGLHPALAKTILPLPVYQVATRPLTPEARQDILPHGHALTDSSANVFSIRFDAIGRLITACSGQPELGFDALSVEINRRLEAMIPSYRATPLDYAWKGTAWLNSSLLPRVLAIDEGLFAIQACNGRGLALTTIIGREVAGMLTDPTHAPLIPLERPRSVPGYSFARHLPSLIMAGAGLAKRARRAAAAFVSP